MKKTLLVTGSTDGIGLATAKTLVQAGHRVLLHGRSKTKVAAAKEQLLAISDQAEVESYVADFSVLTEVSALARAVKSKHAHLDVLINNAGVFKTKEHISAEGLDSRFVVNSIAPYLLTKELLPILGSTGRVINLSSAAQQSLNPSDLGIPSRIEEGIVYAQSKLALTMWSRHMAELIGSEGAAFIAVNPGSLLDSKMVREAYGFSRDGVQKGADILVRAALSEDFANVTGLYFDNDIQQFSVPHPDAMKAEKNATIVQKIEEILASMHVARVSPLV